jgi:hypothetical protein
MRWRAGPPQRGSRKEHLRGMKIIIAANIHFYLIWLIIVARILDWG